MKTVTTLLAGLTLGLFSLQASANLLSDPSFENPLTYDGMEPFEGRWEGFFAPNGDSATSTTLPRTGDQSLELLTFADNTFAGAFQDVGGLMEGQSVLYSGWHLSLAEPGGIEIRIEWRDSITDTEISRTVNFSPTIGNMYEMFSLNSIVPAGADTARVVYAIQSFGGATTQQVFVDDLSFIVEGGMEVAEPGVLGLIGFGVILIALRRRRV